MAKDIETLPGFTDRPHLDKVRAHPFVKWAGGKRALIPEISKRLPKFIVSYWEPFIGGGALFFALGNRVNTAMLSDINTELVLTYRVIQNSPEALIRRLLEHSERHVEEDYYYKVRNMADLRNSVDIAARFIYLNRTGYNGLYRVNKRGKFNVPKGRYKNPTICDAGNIRNVSGALRKAVLKFDDFEHIRPKYGDFVYCDPPYHGTFTEYTPQGFDDDDQIRLRDAVLRWSKIGANVMISNSDTPFIQDLYSDQSQFLLHRVEAPRNINSNARGRKSTSELLITTYGIATN